MDVNEENLESDSKLLCHKYGLCRVTYKYSSLYGKKCFHYECANRTQEQGRAVHGECGQRKGLRVGSSPMPPACCPPPGLSNPTFIFTTICQVRNYLHPHFTDSSLRPREGWPSPDVMVKCTQPVLVLTRQPPCQAVA